MEQDKKDEESKSSEELEGLSMRLVEILSDFVKNNNLNNLDYLTITLNVSFNALFGALIDKKDFISQLIAHAKYYQKARKEATKNE